VYHRAAALASDTLASDTERPDAVSAALAPLLIARDQ
jgi:hypothetical protein